jgi:hypothetical protein
MLGGPNHEPQLVSRARRLDRCRHLVHAWERRTLCTASGRCQVERLCAAVAAVRTTHRYRTRVRRRAHANGNRRSDQRAARDGKKPHIAGVAKTCDGAGAVRIMRAHLDHLEEQAELYALGLLSSADTERVDAHARTCLECTQRLGRAEAAVAALVDATAPRETTPAALRESVPVVPDPQIARVRRASRSPGAAAVVCAITTGAVGTQNIALQSTVTTDGTVFSTMVHSHFNHAQFVSPEGTPIDAKSRVRTARREVSDSGDGDRSQHAGRGRARRYRHRARHPIHRKRRRADAYVTSPRRHRRIAPARRAGAAGRVRPPRPHRRPAMSSDLDARRGARATR